MLTPLTFPLCEFHRLDALWQKTFLKNFPLTKPGDGKLNNTTHCLCLKNTIVKTNPVSPSYGSCFLPLFRLNLLVFSAVFHPG